MLQVSRGGAHLWGSGMARSTCGTPEAGTHTAHAQCCLARGKLACTSSGTRGTQEARVERRTKPRTHGTEIENCGGTLWPHVNTGADPGLLDPRPREAVLGDDPADEGGHGDAAVLDLGLAVPPKPAQSVARTRGQLSFERPADPRIERQLAPCPDVHGVASYRGQVERVPRPDAGLNIVAAELDQHLAGLIPVLVPPGRDWQSTGRTGSGEHAANGSANRWFRGSNGGRSQV